MFETIVVATDGSDLATKAVGIAAELTRNCGAHLIVTTVVDLTASSWLHALAAGEHDCQPRRAGHPIAGGVPGWMDDAMAASSNIGTEGAFADEMAKIVLGHAVAAAKEAGVERPVPVLGHGDPVDAILKVVERERADLLVFGSNGLGAIRGLILGSVSMKLNQLAPCPCLVVK